MPYLEWWGEHPYLGTLALLVPSLLGYSLLALALTPRKPDDDDEVAP